MTAAGPSGDGAACPSCGAAADPQAGFCTACGAALRARRVPPRALWAVLAALAVGAIAVAVMVRRGDDGVGEGPAVVADPVEVIDTTTLPDSSALPSTAPATTAAPTTTVAPATAPATTAAPTSTAAPLTTPATTAAPTTTVPPTPTPATTAAPATTVPPPPPPTPVTTAAPATTAPPETAVDAGTPRFFATPEEAIFDHLSLVEPPYAGPCDTLAGREVELGGVVTCSVLDQDLRPQQIHRWGVFATDDLRGWLLLDVGSAGWSVADETFELSPPEEWRLIGT